MEDNTQRPDVRLEAIRLVVDNLWTEVGWGADDCLSFRPSIRKYTCDTEISELYDFLLSQEEIV